MCWIAWYPSRTVCMGPVAIAERCAQHSLSTFPFPSSPELFLCLQCLLLFRLPGELQWNVLPDHCSLRQGTTLMFLGAKVFHSPWLTHTAFTSSRNSNLESFFIFFPGSLFKIDWYIEIKEAFWRVKKHKGRNQCSQIHFSVITFSLKALPIVWFPFCKTCWPYVFLPTWLLISDSEEATVWKWLFWNCLRLFALISLLSGK